MGIADENRKVRELEMIEETISEENLESIEDDDK